MKNGFYDDTRFFRVLDGFMAQFGLNGDPEIQASGNGQPRRRAGETEQPARLRDRLSANPARIRDTRWSSSTTRTTAHLDADGFAPFGQVVAGMDAVDKLYSGYGRTNVPDQRRIVGGKRLHFSRNIPSSISSGPRRIERVPNQ